MSEDGEHDRDSRDRAFKLYEWVGLLRNVVPTETAIDLVRSRFQQSTGDDKDTLAFELEHLLIRERQFDEASRLLDEMIASRPDDVIYPISKAWLYSFHLDKPEEALEWIEVALARAFRTGAWVRNALGAKARILVDLRRGDELGQVLEQIMSHKVQRDLPDIGRERDFVDAASPGLISEDILARYDKFCPGRAGDSPHEPPKFEPPEWGLDGEEARVTRAR